MSSAPRRPASGADSFCTPEPESLGPAAPGFPEQEEDELHRTLGVERFEEILQEAGSRGGEEPGRSYGEEDFEYHRQSSHHIHHPLSTHLPPDTRRRKTPQGPGRKPRRRPGASPTGETPTIEEGEEEEDEASEAEGARALTQPSPASTPSSVQFFLQEDEGADRKAERTSPSPPPPLPHQEAAPRASKGAQTGAPAEEVVAVASGTAGGDDGGASARPLTKAQPGHRSYNLQERRRIGSMTGAEQALLPRVPTDESEAQTLATADLDLMKSECRPGPARHWWEQEGEKAGAWPCPPCLLQVTGLRTFLECGGTWCGRMPKGLGRAAGKGESLAPRLGPDPGPPTSPMRYLWN